MTDTPCGTVSIAVLFLHELLVSQFVSDFQNFFGYEPSVGEIVLRLILFYSN